MYRVYVSVKTKQEESFGGSLTLWFEEYDKMRLCLETIYNTAENAGVYVHIEKTEETFKGDLGAWLREQ